MKNMKKYGIMLIAAGLMISACQNPVDIVEEATKVVMEANDRYIEVTSLYPARNASDINASAVITVDFDREIDPDSFTDNIFLYYGSDETNQFDPGWFEYDSVLQRLIIDADPWLTSSETVTVTIQNLVAVDGSEMLEKETWFFQTNNDAAFDLTIDAEHANIDNHDSIPLLMEFSTADDIWYYLSMDSTLTVSTVPAYNPATWTEVTSASMSDTASFTTEGVSEALYLWVYDHSDGGSGLLTTNGKTEAEYLLVDLTEPTVSAGSEVYTNAAHTFTATASDENGIASYAWSGPGECSFSPSNAASTDVSSSSEGTKTLTVTVTDGVGNEGSATVDLIWDTTAPDVPGTAPDLDNDYDSGTSNTDNITNKTEGLAFSGTSEADAEIELYADSTLIGSTTANVSGNWECSATEDFSEGENTYSITVRSVDRAGNRSDPSPALSLTVDTVANDPSAPDLYYEDDKGESDSDNLTNQTTDLTIKGTCEPNAFLEYEEYTSGYSGAFYVDGTGTYSFDLPTLGEDYYELEVHQVDVAGNSSTWSDTLAFEVDTTDPTGSISLTGSTGEADYTHSGSVTAALSYSDDNGVWKVGLRNDSPTTSYSFTDFSPSSTINWSLRTNSGVRGVMLRITDKAGNTKDIPDTINYYMPVNVKLGFIRVDTSNELGEEDWFWDFDLYNGDSYSDAFSRSALNSYSYDITGLSTAGRVIGYVEKTDTVYVPAAYRDANSAIPYTYTTYVDVSDLDGIVSIKGYVGEYDGGKIDQKTDTEWFTYITTNAHTLGTSTTSEIYSLTDGSYLTDVYIGVSYWASVSYSDTGY